MKTYALVPIGLLIIVSLLSGCEEQSSTPPTARVTEVSYINVTSTEHKIDTKLQGRVTASMVAEVRPQVSGIIQKRLFTEGQMVKQGQTLYQIDPETYEAAYNEAKATLNSAKATVATAKLKDERYANLLKIEGVSQQDADDAHAAHLEAKANIEMYEAALETARINLEYTKVLAPISGHIGISTVTQGALVTAQQDTALATIRTLDPIYVDMTKNSKALLKLRKLMRENNIKEGTTDVALTLEDGSDYELAGELKMQEVAVDASTGAVTLRAEFSNPDGLLLPGMFVRATVSEAVDENAILVPQQGIYHEATGAAFAYVINQDNQVEKRIVETINAVGNKWLLDNGLSVNEKLLVEGSGKVAPGSTVKPVQVEMNSAGTMVTVVDSNATNVSSLGNK
ncbi:efflux RND transporter periplasmic adaptor subunit [uncultured Alteromonas sp.]|jgi:membrane fusion protein (multidrug efflux system)|uniref:efflux RND transporter periplasmic adaptor subunit n=1 Tax=uncultured Alteromonas sp. TaxID=179113 RepID=UPI0030D58663|tara:strand:- start:7993 stop:9186 length:1194 start_codon:yes stop_codon:yes gene_type:complete